jgi:hypothetical protein
VEETSVCERREVEDCKREIVERKGMEVREAEGVHGKNSRWSCCVCEENENQ